MIDIWSCTRCGDLSRYIQSFFKILRLSAFIVLSVATIWFVEDMFEEYLAGKTNYHISRKDLTNSDNPAIAICLDLWDPLLEVGPDIVFNVSQYDKYDTKQTKQVDVKITTLDTELTEIHNEHVWGRLKCFQLEPLKNDLTEWVTRVDLHGKFFTSLAGNLSYVFFTTEENAIGAIMHKFFDGGVERLEFFPGHRYSLKLSHVTEYKLINQKCTKIPYYQCLGSLLQASEECEDLGGLCNVVSLPGVQLPKCTTEAYNCSSDVFWDIYLSKNCQSEDERLCHEIEYDYDGEKYQIERKEILDNEIFSFDFHLALPSSSRGDRLSRPYKIVKTEHFVWSELSLTANMGGILSMTLQFSFIATLKYLIRKMITVRSKYKNLRINTANNNSPFS